MKLRRTHNAPSPMDPSEKLLRELVRETLDLVFIKDRDGRYLVANPASALVAGRPVNEILGRTDEDVFPPEQARQFRDADQRILASGQGETYDESFVVGGEVRHFSTAKMPHRDEDGAALGIVGISRDITDRKRAEEALARLAAENQTLLERARAEERWLGTILGRTPMPLVFVEPQTARVFFANAAADKMAGGLLPRPTNVAEHGQCFDMREIAGRRLGADEMPLVRAARGEDLNGFQFCWVFPDGGARTLVAYSARLPAVDGHAETVMLAFDDITALKQVQGQLEEAVRVRQDFLSVAGHELRTPLTSLLLIARSLEKAVATPSPLPPLQADARLADRWRALHRQIARLTGLVDRLLDVSRISAGKLTLDLDRLDLAEAARDVAGRFPEAESRQITLDASTVVEGRWDRMRVEQIITNLLSNAVTYGEGRPITLTVRGAEAHGEIVVRDQGIGIAPEALSRIFERFERAASGRQYGGLGLGLWIVRQLVEAMDGSITVDSTLGRGSAFTVRLPVRAIDQPQV